MTIVRKIGISQLLLTTFTLAVGFLASFATAQTRTTTSSVGLPITTSTWVTVAPGETFHSGAVHEPTCPKSTSFLVTAVQATPDLDDAVGLPKWAVSIAVLQLATNGSFSPNLTAFADGPQQASTSIPGGQPLNSFADNVHIRLLGSAATEFTQFTVHVTGYCGMPLVTPS